MASCAAESWPRPAVDEYEIRHFAELALRLAQAWERRRVMTSCMEAKSLAPTTVLMRKWRYSLRAEEPSIITTMEATESAPCVLEMS